MQARNSAGILDIFTKLVGAQGSYVTIKSIFQTFIRLVLDYTVNGEKIRNLFKK